MAPFYQGQRETPVHSGELTIRSIDNNRGGGQGIALRIDDCTAQRLTEANKRTAQDEQKEN